MNKRNTKRDNERFELVKRRVERKLTQRQMAIHLSISLRHYQHIEAGDRAGSFEVWDALEDLFQTHQRVLRSVRPSSSSIEIP